MTDRQERVFKSLSSYISIGAVILSPAVAIAVHKAVTENRLAAVEKAVSDQSKAGDDLREKVADIRESMARVETKIDDLRQANRSKQ